MGGRPFQPRFALAHPALRVDHVEAVAPSGNQRGNDFRRVLQIGVDHDYRVAACVIQAGGDGDFLAEIARQTDRCNAVIGPPKCLDGRPRIVGTAVVDVNDFPLAQGIHHREKARMECRQPHGLIEGRNDHRELRVRAGRKKMRCDVRHRVIC